MKTLILILGLLAACEEDDTGYDPGCDSYGDECDGWEVECNLRYTNNIDVCRCGRWEHGMNCDDISVSADCLNGKCEWLHKYDPDKWTVPFFACAEGRSLRIPPIGMMGQSDDNWCCVSGMWTTHYLCTQFPDSHCATYEDNVCDV